MTRERCIRCGNSNITTASPNGIEGVWLSDEQMEKIDELKISGQGEVSPRMWIGQHGIRSIRCSECHDICKTEDETCKKEPKSVICDICGYPCEPSAKAWHDNGAKHLNRHMTCRDVEQNGRQVDEIIALIDTVDDIEYIREICREKGLL